MKWVGIEVTDYDMPYFSVCPRAVPYKMVNLANTWTLVFIVYDPELCWGYIVREGGNERARMHFPDEDAAKFAAELRFA